MSRRVRIALAALSSAALFLGVAGPAPTAAASAPASPLAPLALATTSLSGWPTTTLRMRVGGELSRVVSVSPAGARTVEVQYRKGTSGTIRTFSRYTTTSAGSATVRFRPASAATWYVRVRVLATSTLAARTSGWRPVIASGTAGATSASTPAASPSSVDAGTAQTFRTVVKPAGARTIELWGRAPGSATFSLRRTTISSSTTGAASVSFAPTKAGLWSYRFVVRPSLTLAGTTTSIRTSLALQPDTTPPAAVTGLAVDVDGAVGTAVLTWTNPTTDLHHVVVRRTLASEPVPTVSGGTGVAVPSPTADTATDTGLDGGTEYRWSVFAVDAKGNASAPAHITGTALAAAYSWEEVAPAQYLHGYLTSVSCSSTTSCYAIDSNGYFVYWDGGGWQIPYNITFAYGEHLRDVSCTSQEFCVLVALSGKVWSHFGPVATSWNQVTTLPGVLTSVSCAAQGGTTLCVAGDTQGRAYTSSDGSAWSGPTTVTAHVITDVSCPTPTWCLAVDSGGGAIVRDAGADPVWGAREAISDGVQLNGVSCSSASFCVAVGAAGKAVVGSPGAWSASTISGGRNLAAVSCLSSTFCQASDESGFFIPYTGSWGTAAKPNGGNSYSTIAGVSCVTTSFCMAVSADSFGTAWRYGASGWVRSAFIDADNRVRDVDCVSPSFCALVSLQGDLKTYDGAGWMLWDTQNHPYGMAAVDCVTSTFCVALDVFGRAYVWTGPWSDGGQGWVGPTNALSGGTVIDVECPTSSFCVALGGSGEVSVYDGSMWSEPAGVTGGAGALGLGCASASACIITTSASTTVTWNGESWASPGPAETPVDVYDVTCLTPTWCMGVDSGRTGVRLYNGSDWGPLQDIEGDLFVGLLACSSMTSCIATSNAAGAVSRFDGSTWSTPYAATAELPAAALSCPTDRWCYLVDAAGRAYIGTR